MKKLVIISHTDHQLNADGQIAGWGPTVTEINYLADFWDEVVHVACFEQGPARGSSLPYTKKNIRLAAIPPFGGKRLADKLSVITKAPTIIRTVNEALKGATHVQMRVPMGIGVYLLPYMTLRRRSDRIFWVKYANNWAQEDAPPGYAFQRWFLKNDLASCKVTINGFWPGQPAHCISFENPSLRQDDLMAGGKARDSKDHMGPFVFTFIGRLDDEKGVGRILEALRNMAPDRIGHVHFIGDGKGMQGYRQTAEFLGDKVSFHGYCNGTFIREILSRSHFFLLPTTASEGFPKVVAEACCYGCIPVVSDTGSIPHYVHDRENGFIWHTREAASYGEILAEAAGADPIHLKEMAGKGAALAEKFTLERYYERLNSEIFGM